VLKNRADEYDSFVCGIDETSERVDLVMTIFIRTFNERSGVSAADREIRTWKPDSTRLIPKQSNPAG